jgi:multiple sugar transport system permease protein
MATRRKKAGINGSTIVIALILILAALWSAFPFLFALRNAFMELQDTYRPLFIPFLQFEPTLQTWASELSPRSGLRSALQNSIIVAVMTLLITLPLGTLAGYALARFSYRLPDNPNLLFWFLSQRMLPPAVVIVPFLLMMRSACGPIELPYLGIALPQPLQLYCLATDSRSLLNNLASLVIAHVTFNLPFVVLITRSIFKDLPKALEEAALVDGASALAVFRHIALPLAGPGLVAAALITFAFSWNEFIFALILTGPATVTLPLMIGSGEGIRSVDYPVVSVRALIAILPPVIFALLAQRFIVRGLTLGTVKG